MTQAAQGKKERKEIRRKKMKEEERNDVALKRKKMKEEAQIKSKERKEKLTKRPVKDQIEKRKA